MSLSFTILATHSLNRIIAIIMSLFAQLSERLHYNLKLNHLRRGWFTERFTHSSFNKSHKGFLPLSLSLFTSYCIRCHLREDYKIPFYCTDCTECLLNSVLIQKCILGQPAATSKAAAAPSRFHWNPYSCRLKEGRKHKISLKITFNSFAQTLQVHLINIYPLFAMRGRFTYSNLQSDPG